MGTIQLAVKLCWNIHRILQNKTRQSRLGPERYHVHDGKNANQNADLCHYLGVWAASNASWLEMRHQVALADDHRCVQVQVSRFRGPRPPQQLRSKELQVELYRFYWADCPGNDQGRSRWWPRSPQANHYCDICGFNRFLVVQVSLQYLHKYENLPGKWMFSTCFLRLLLSLKVFPQSKHLCKPGPSLTM